MTTQMPLLGNSTANGYLPVSKPPTDGGEGTNTGAAGTTTSPAGAVRDTANGINTAPQRAGSSAATPAGSTPGAGASIAAPDTSALGQDPAYLAYLRALGVADTTHSAAIQSQIDGLNRNVQLRLPQMQQDAQFANNRLLGGMEARGILNSGETENNLSQQQSLQQRQQAALQDSAAQRTADLVNQLAIFRANQGVGAAEQGMNAGQKIAANNGNQQINDQTAAIGTALGI